MDTRKVLALSAVDGCLRLFTEEGSGTRDKWLANSVLNGVMGHFWKFKNRS